MKSLRINLSTLTFALLLAAPCLAAGGGSDGGANSVNQKIVEEYSVDPSDMRGYDLFKQKVEMLKKELPEFGKLVEERATAMHWYILPRKITTLPSEKTGLYFDTEQMAFQTKTEVFVNQDEVKDSSEVGGAKLLMHESVMSALEDKPSEGVRAAVNRIFAKNFSARELQKELAKSHLGSYFTPAEWDELGREKVKPYFASLSRITNDAEKACGEGKSPSEIRAALGDRLYYENQPTWGKVRSPFVNIHDESNYPGNLYLLSSGNATNNDMVNMGFLETACDSNAKIKGNPACNEIEKSRLAHLGIMEFLEDFTKLTEVELNSLATIRRQLQSADRKDYYRAFQSLLANPDFLNVLALNSPVPDKKFEEFESSPKRPAYVKKIFDLVHARRDALSNIDEKTKRNILCSSIGKVDELVRKKAGLVNDKEPGADSDEDQDKGPVSNSLGTAETGNGSAE